MPSSLSVNCQEIADNQLANDQLQAIAQDEYAALCELAQGFKDALAFVETDQDGNKKHLFFFPGFNSKGGSKERCNTVFARIETAMRNADQLGITISKFQKKYFTINQGRSKTGLYCIEADGYISELFDKIERFNIPLPVKKWIESDSLASLEVPETMEKYFNNNTIKLPNHVNGAPNAGFLEKVRNSRDTKSFVMGPY